jgi:hypothetical protein
MNQGTEAKTSKPLRLVVIAIVSLSVVFAVGLGVLIFYMIRPAGDRVGQISLTDPNASLVVDGKPGDTLVFRVDASVSMPRFSTMSDDVLERHASTQLTRSQLTVHATAPSGAERSSRCAVYKGRAMSTTTTSGSFSRTGMLNDCVIALDEAGPWKVRGVVAWTTDLTPRSATLEARIDPARR